MLLQIRNAGLRIACTRHPFIGKRPRHNRNGECAELACTLRDNGSCARPRAATHAGSDKDHVCTAQCLHNLLTALRRSRLPDLGTCARSEPARTLFTDLNAHCSLRLQKCLCICIDCNKLDPLQAGVDHIIYRVTAAAAHTDNDDLCEFLKVIIHFEHSFSLHIVSVSC